MSLAPIYTAADARALTDRIKVAVEACWHLIAEAYQSRAWVALGYTSWDDYTTREFGTSRLRLPREDRPEVVASLRDAGLSIRAIAAVTGDHYSTVSRELGRVADATPDDGEPDDLDEHNDELEPRSVTGTDGKSYPAKTKTPAAPRRNPLPDVAKAAGWKLRRSLERLQRVFDDDRFDTYKEQVAPELRGHLLNIVEVCQDLLDQLP